MRILQINCVYGEGSTGKIVKEIHSHLLSNGIESYVCYGRGEKTTDQNVIRTCSNLYSKANNLLTRITGLMYGGCYASTIRLIRQISLINPDIVHVHCINGYFVNIYELITFLKKAGFPTLLTLHAEFMYTGNCGHALDCEKWKTGCGDCPRRRVETKSILVDGTAKSWKLMREAFTGYKKIIIASVSPWLMKRAKQSPIMNSFRHTVILNGLDTGTFSYSPDAKLSNSVKGLDCRFLLIHVTPHFTLDKNSIKGGYYINELAKILPDGIKILVVGNADQTKKVSDKIIFWGVEKNPRILAKLYSIADISLLTSKKETYSMVTVESLCCGTPIIGFQAGAPEQIAIPDYSKFVDNGNIEQLFNAIMDCMSKSWDKQKIAENAKARYSSEQMCKNYIETYQELIRMSEDMEEILD